MKFLVIGLGSMGKRRIRCLKALGHSDISGFDVRSDRCNEVLAQHGINVYSDFDEAFKSCLPDALIISVPPDLHHHYMKVALEHTIHFFVEASVVDTDMEEIRSRLKSVAIIAAPSATLIYHPAIRQIRDVINSGRLGKLSNIIHHSGQYLPDWHTYEPVANYYVSNPETSGGREIVPFELSWLTTVFGFPQRVCGNFRKTIAIKGAEKICDTYNALLDYSDFLVSLTVDVVSRHAVRRLLINGEKGQLVWDWDENAIRVFDPKTEEWERIPYDMGNATPGYNANIGESMYVDEVRNFIEAIKGVRPFANTMDNDHRVLKLLYAIEEADQTSRYVRFEA
jgi:predicted dehydrogenase